MRHAFAQERTQLAANNERLVLLSGDIGNKLFDPFKLKYPERFFNCGVAEANMASVAAGMAMCGLRPITYTITPFNTTRCLEQIRDDICYHNVPVLIVGTGSGLSYASLGCTHHSCEDISFLRSMPNMTVLCPGDSMELRSLLTLATDLPGPAYLRIGKTKDPVVHAAPPKLEIGKGFTLQQGLDLCILSTGNMLSTSVETASLLNQKGIQPEVISFHTVKPLDKELLQSLVSRFSLIVVLEEHSLIGGLGSAISEWMADEGPFTTKLLRFGTPDLFPHRVGSQQYLREAYGLVPEQISQCIQKQIESASCVH
jgi:transketolase